MAARKRSTRKRTVKPSAARRNMTVARGKAAAATKERRVQQPETLRLGAFEPSLTVNDLEQSSRFYVDVLGFVVGQRWTDAGVLRGVTLKAGASQLGLSQDDWAKGRDRKKGDGMRLWCRTSQDIDRLAARIKAAGARLTEEPKDEWSMRSLSVDDPDGYHLTIYRRK